MTEGEDTGDLTGCDSAWNSKRSTWNTLVSFPFAPPVLLPAETTPDGRVVEQTLQFAVPLESFWDMPICDVPAPPPS
jgi:hypothetical protein